MAIKKIWTFWTSITYVKTSIWSIKETMFTAPAIAHATTTNSIAMHDQDHQVVFILLLLLLLLLLFLLLLLHLTCSITIIPLPLPLRLHETVLLSVRFLLSLLFHLLLYSNPRCSS